MGFWDRWYLLRCAVLGKQPFEALLRGMAEVSEKLDLLIELERLSDEPLAFETEAGDEQPVDDEQPFEIGSAWLM